jgi:hypothetical protein
MDPVSGTLVLAGMSTALQVAGTIAQGNSQRSAADYQAAQLNQQAGQTRATAQRQAIDDRRKATLVMEQGQARAAASGAGATDPTVTALEDNVAGQGEYNALAHIYSGEERARGAETEATTKQFEGEQAFKSSQIKAGTTLLSSGSTLASKYGDTEENLPWLNGVRAGTLAPNSYTNYG